MTHAERAEIERVSSLVLSWQPHDDSRFVRLLAHPCPLLASDEQGQAVCTVHAVRPYNCRRWGCFRDDCSEAVDMRVIPVHVLKSRELRRQYARLQRKAQGWAMAHGWES